MGRAVLPGRALWAIEVKRSAAPKLERGFTLACADVSPTHRFVVYGGRERYKMNPDTEAMSLRDLAADLRAMR
jgi:hypothetical protein